MPKQQSHCTLNEASNGLTSNNMAYNKMMFGGTVRNSSIRRAIRKSNKVKAGKLRTQQTSKGFGGST